MADAPILGGTKKAKLDDAAFGAEFNGPLVHESVRAELNARRQGTHVDQDPRQRPRRRRQAVAPEGHRPRPRRLEPLADLDRRRHVFGPSPRHYTFKVNRKERRAALRSALSVHAERGSLAVFDPKPFDDAVDQGGREAARRLARRAARARARRARRRAGPRRAVVPQPGPRSRSCPAQRCGVADLIGAASVICTEAALDALTARAKGEKNEEAVGLMDHSQVIIRPVVSEKSLRARRGRQVHLPRPPRRAQDADPPGGRVALRRQRARGPHDVASSPSPSAAGSPRAARARGRRPSCRCAPATRSRSSRASRGSRRASMAIRKPKPTSPGRRFSTYPDFAEITKTEPEKTPRRGPEEVRRAQRSRAQDVAPSRRRRQAPVPQDRLQAPQGRHPGQGRRDRVRPQPVGVHRAAALRRRREGLHPGPGAPARSA